MKQGAKDWLDFYFASNPKNDLKAEEIQLELDRINRILDEISANKDFMDDEIFKKVCENLVGLSIYYIDKLNKKEKRLLNKKQGVKNGNENTNR